MKFAPMMRAVACAFATIPAAAQPVATEAAFCNPACAGGQLCGANHQCLQLVPSSPSAPPEAHEAAPTRLPKVAVVLLPEASLTFGNGLFATAEVGTALQVRFQRLAVGLRVASGFSMDGFNDYQSCQDEFCAERRTRYGLNLEYTLHAVRIGQAWVGVDAEAVKVNGWYDGINGGSSGDPVVQRTGAFVTAKAGFEFSKKWSHGLIGICPFGGLTLGGVSDANGFGVTLGSRVSFGVF
jgi:hypothetical protein